MKLFLRSKNCSNSEVLVHELLLIYCFWFIPFYVLQSNFFCSFLERVCCRGPHARNDQFSLIPLPKISRALDCCLHTSWVNISLNGRYFLWLILISEKPQTRRTRELTLKFFTVSDCCSCDCFLFNNHSLQKSHLFHKSPLKFCLNIFFCLKRRPLFLANISHCSL